MKKNTRITRTTKTKKSKDSSDSGWAALLAYFIELETNELKKKKVSQ